MKKKKEMTKRVLSLLLTAVLSISLLSAISVNVHGAGSPNLEDITPVPNDETGIPDKALYQYLLKEYDKDEDGMLSISEAKKVYWLGLYPQSAEERVGTFKNLSEFAPNITQMQYIDYNEDGGQTVFTAEDFKEFANIPSFTSINLYGVKLEDESSIAQMSQLESISLDNCGVIDSSFVNAENFPNLEILDLGRNEELISAPAAIAEMTALRSLNFLNCGLTEFPDVSKLTNLTYLEIGGNNFSEVSGISGLTNLQSLGLFGNKLETLPDLSQLVNLKDLDLGYMDLSEVPSLSHMTQLEGLRIYGNKLTTLPDMTGLTNLSDIMLSDNFLSEEEIIAKLPAHITADADWVAEAVSRQKRAVNTKLTTDVTNVEPGETINVTFVIENQGAPIKNLSIDLSADINGTNTYIIPEEDIYTFTETGIVMDIGFGETITITYAVDTEEDWNGYYIYFRGDAYLADSYLSGGMAYSDSVRVGTASQGGQGNLLEVSVKSITVSNKNIVLTDDNYNQAVTVRIALEGADVASVKDGDILYLYYGLENAESYYGMQAKYDSASGEFVTNIPISGSYYEAGKEYKVIGMSLSGGSVPYSENTTLFTVTNQLSDQLPPTLEGVQIYINGVLQTGYKFALKPNDVIEVRANASDNSGTLVGSILFYAEKMEDAYLAGKNYYAIGSLLSGNYDLEGKLTVDSNLYEGTYILTNFELYDKYNNRKSYTGEEVAALYKEVTVKENSSYVPDYDDEDEEEEVTTPTPTPAPVVKPQTAPTPVQSQDENEEKVIGLDETVIFEKVEEAAVAEAGATVSVNMKKEDGSLATELPVDVLNAVKGKDVNVVLNMGSYSWTINGNDITAEDIKAIDLEVILDTDAVPSDIVAQKAGEQPTRQISLTHNGEFGFKAKLSINMGSEYAGEYANLYYYNLEKELEFMNASIIKEDGSVDLDFSHASDYVIVVDENATETETIVESTEEAEVTEVTETVSTEAANVEGVEQVENESGSFGIILAVIVVIAVAGLILIKKKK